MIAVQITLLFLLRFVVFCGYCGGGAKSGFRSFRNSGCLPGYRRRTVCNTYPFSSIRYIRKPVLFSLSVVSVSRFVIGNQLGVSQFRFRQQIIIVEAGRRYAGNVPALAPEIGIKRSIFEHSPMSGVNFVARHPQFPFA